MIKTNILKTLQNPFQHHCPNFLSPDQTWGMLQQLQNEIQIFN